MKKIAITQRLVENDSYYEIRDCLDVRWSLLLKEISCLPILLPSHFDFKEYFNEFEIEGIILTGGNDLGWLSEKELDKRRDAFEKKIVYYATENRIPLLGVCRGMQILGEFFGMKLEKVENHVATRHQINKLEDSFNRTYVEPLDEVNSYHNYGFRKVSDDFKIVYTSQDGVIEAMEHKNFPFLAIMWHPEREIIFNRRDLNLLDTVFNNNNIKENTSL